MLGGNLGAFTQGVFGGAQAVQNITASNQELQQRQYALQAAQAVQAASSGPYAEQDPGAAVQPIQEGATAASPDTGGSDQPPPVSAGAIPTTSGPVADVSKLPPLAAKAPPAAPAPPVSSQDAAAATDPLSAGDGPAPAAPAASGSSPASGSALDWQGWAAGGPVPTAAAPAAPAAPAASGPSPASGSTSPAPSLGARILNAVNPVGTAGAATSSPLPAAAQATSPPDLSVPAPSSALMQALRSPDRRTPTSLQDAPGAAGTSDAASPPELGPATMTLPQQAAPGQAPDARTSNDVTTRTAFDGRPYAALMAQAPAYAKMVDQAADKYGVTPARLALHWNNESSLNTAAPDSATGAQGPLQIQPATARYLDPTGARDPTKLPDALDLAAQNIHLADTRYGRDTPLSVAAYQGGNGSADAIAAGEGAHHPNTVAYMAKSFPGQTLGPDQLQPGHAMSPAGIVQAAQQGGPDGVLNFIARSGPAAAPLSDKWRQAESALMTAAAAKGDIAGMTHARDFVFQQLHQGNATSLINAYQALQAGDGVSAAQQLARANAFFPDGATSRFGTDNQGNVWMQRVDEHDPTKPLGPPAQVTAERLQTMLLQTQDPNEFARTLAEQQRQVAQIRLEQQHGAYYSQLAGVREYMADRQAQTQQAVARTRASALTAAAGIRAGASEYGADQRLQGASVRGGALDRAGAAAPPGVNGLKPNQIDSEATRFYGGQDATPSGPMQPEQAGLASEIHQELRANTPGMTALGARSLTLGLLGGGNVLRPVGNGLYGVFPRGAQSGQPSAVISGAVAQRFGRLMMPGGLGTPGRPGSGGALGLGSTPPSTVVQPSRSALPSGIGGPPGGALDYATSGGTMTPGRSALPTGALSAGY